MNSITVVLMVLVGAVILYASIKGENPIDLLKSAVTRGN